MARKQATPSRKAPPATPPSAKARVSILFPGIWHSRIPLRCGTPRHTPRKQHVLTWAISCPQAAGKLPGSPTGPEWASPGRKRSRKLFEDFEGLPAPQPEGRFRSPTADRWRTSESHKHARCSRLDAPPAGSAIQRAIPRSRFSPCSPLKHTRLCALSCRFSCSACLRLLQACARAEIPTPACAPIPLRRPPQQRRRRGCRCPAVAGVRSPCGVDQPGRGGGPQRRPRCHQHRGCTGGGAAAADEHTTAWTR